MKTNAVADGVFTPDLAGKAKAKDVAQSVIDAL